MKQKIAIDPHLTPIKDFLTDKGYQVESMNSSRENSGNTSNFDALIVSGIDTNFLGMHNTNTKAVVINAAGMTPEQVYHELQSKLE